VSAHYFHNHHTVVTLSSGVQPVDGIGGNLHGRIEPERHVGTKNVVVDRLGHTDDGNAMLGVKPAGNTEAAVPTDHDQSGQHAAHGFNRQRHRVSIHHAVPGIDKSNELVAIVALALSHNSANHRVKAWAVASTGQDPHSHSTPAYATPRSGARSVRKRSNRRGSSGCGW
jgi:hypothetical protein